MNQEEGVPSIQRFNGSTIQQPSTPTIRQPHVSCRPVEDRDREDLVRLLFQEGVQLAGLADRQVYRVLIDDAVRERGPHVMLVLQDGRIAGWLIAVADSRRYWMRVAATHPGIAAKMFLSTIRNRISRASERVQHIAAEIEDWVPRECFVPEELPGWGQSAPDLAKLADIVVLPHLRDHGLGEVLLHHLLCRLHAAGIRRAEGVVKCHKRRWIQYIARQGFTFAGVKGDNLLVIRDLHRAPAWAPAKTTPSGEPSAVDPPAVLSNRNENLSDSAWTDGEAVLRWRLGEFILREWRFPALLYRGTFLDIPESLALTPPASLRAGGRPGSAAIRSCPVPRTLPTLESVGGTYRYVKARYRHYSIRVSGSFEGYLAAFRPKTRATLLRKVRRFERSYPSPSSFRTFLDPESLRDFWPLARRVSAATFQERFLRQGLPITRDLPEEAGDGEPSGAFRGYLLMAGTRPVSYVFGPVRDGRVFVYEYVGYDPDFGYLSPGIVLQYYIVRHLFREGLIEAYDLCVGEGEHKRIFATHRRDCADLYYLERSARNLFMITGDLVLRGLSRTVVSLLDRLRMKSRVKKLIRRRFSG